MISDDQAQLADGRSVPIAAVIALYELEKTWPGATLRQARPAIVAVVMNALGEMGDEA